MSALSARREYDVASLCDLSRWRGRAWLAACYIPVGAVLLVLRLLALGILAAVAWFVPTRLKSSLFRLSLLSSGFIVSHELPRAEIARLTHSKVVAYNHVSLIDGLVVWSMPNAVLLAADPASNASTFNSYYFGFLARTFGSSILVLDDLRAFSHKVAKWRKDVNAPAFYIAPEGTIGNGSGLFAFEKFAFGLGRPVVPLCITVKPAFAMRPHPLMSSHLANILWLYALPYVTVELALLDSQSRREGESAVAFAERIQHVMAEHLGAVPTECTRADKRALRARRLAMLEASHG
ncbi:MAG: hypothetical protein GY873_36840 [Bosea sp.]|uniref:hypothetical protein n=1 Tax=Bosea sp. (in: a-proteobacteria) TaxID=1871050 RepID=UPI002393505C|nr:hypothetical protein [Bosea sp. (in: a-proteobacteria)]MCP4739768.1 hypothetical protein [Bosea sp. (in: a-proteobacteria)]